MIIMEYLTALNSQQKKIMKNGSGVVVIKAGPGTGKTKTLTSRITYLLIEKNIQPENILTLTFTKRAATEMKDRLKKILKDTKIGLPTISTFHSFAYDLLQQFGPVLKIISEHQQKEIIKKITGHNVPVRKFYLLLTQYKNGLKTDLNQETRGLVEQYNLELQKNNLVDFDDLIVKLFKILNDDLTFLEQLQNRYHYILVDEFQDTNDLQYQILKLIIGNQNNFFIIGDPNQSIYGFRGANPKIFNQIKKDFPESKEIFLTTNYRSRKQIVNLSNKIFNINLQSSLDSDGEAKLIKTLNEYSEAGWINRFINNKIGGSDLIAANESEKSISFSDFAIIFRTHRQAKYLAQKLDESGLPYQMVGQWSIYQESKIEFICLILRYFNDSTEDNFQEIVDSSFIQRNGRLMIEELKQKIDSIPLQPTISFSTLVENIQQIFFSKEVEKDPNFKYFKGSILQFTKYADGLKKFCDYWEKLKNSDYFDFLGDKITLLTMHSAKGLEFKYVFIAGFEEGLIPYKNKKQGELDEELRLFYVALTRAKAGLYLLEAETRNRNKTTPSSFKKIILGDNLIEEQDEALEKILKKKAKIKLKKSQMSMF